jgi:hypothetical protein
MSDDIARVLAQVVEVGPGTREAELGAAVSRHVSSNRPARRESDPETVAALRATHLGLATTGELLDELRSRIEIAGLADYKTVGGS